MHLCDMISRLVLLAAAGFAVIPYRLRNRTGGNWRRLSREGLPATRSVQSGSEALHSTQNVYVMEGDRL